MFLRSLSLQNFRNYEKADFNFAKDTAIIVGPNTSGKTNFAESIFYLATGRGSKAEKDADLIRFSQNLARLSGVLEDKTELSVVVCREESDTRETIRKKYLVNGVFKRRVDFAGNFACVIFSPEDLDIIIGGPNLRRRLLDNLLEQVDRDYRNATIVYTKALRQRNALLDRVRESGVRNEKLFEYWDDLLINNAAVITKKREEFVQFINDFSKEIFDFIVFYDKSIVSSARLLQYRQAEVGAGVTLVGPHRDDVSFSMFNNTRQTTHDIKSFGSRGQQRLTILQMKIIELSFIEKIIGQKPILILDDIFSELDSGHIKLVLDMLSNQQSIVTTTHKEFIDSKILKNADVIELSK
ncbi:MAG: hypothetical protein A3H50_01550 [Candidatus Levybacteria bacterium RIFCSPLOWO2_02_FULL_37_10]|nr:MAG: hypothetical protein A2860_03260 [Candidatus Levybacteria bacterium RIFCSPHIGHO2_01_FULL_37_33]OGH17443.1 MAG: hypothetical protein A3C97_03270 [Candidatus Levybacteria bacterium RIFCSPHIGHO2_02_FULL_37_11]OGH29883.1 MAG: hypothetical protein A3F30_01695 [Candidatus Levybacteria bacterium RIFCSPHIGHO2_12_FULL_37_12]OGH32989.1 MAG: hypothetical protein A2953_01055 [Candidatus Levybacteria bacterium RIFCSPLOWO2_01_FULL_36_54]OGH43353.1 MAG: hypothetical protein A3H50_01550 [Candidatus Lev